MTTKATPLSAVSTTNKGLAKICGWCIQYNPQRKPWQFTTISKFYWSTYKIHHWTTKRWGGIPFLDTFPKPQGENIAVAVYRKPTHMDRYLDFNSSHPVLTKRAVVRALMDRAENVCSDPEILANEIDHLSKVLHYNNYPQWMINQQGKMEKQDPLIHPETGNEIQKCFYISVPYFPGLSESFKKIFKYTPVQVCFKGVNTLKSMLMHPKDKISNDQKKDLVYHWECKADGCNSSYIGETSRALGERVKEHSKLTTSAILKHCKDFHHPLPSIDDFNIIDKEPPQVTREAKEVIHIRRLDPSLNRNIGKMSIPPLLWQSTRCQT